MGWVSEEDECYVVLDAGDSVAQMLDDVMSLKVELEIMYGVRVTFWDV